MRVAAAWALGTLSTEAALEALEGYREDDDPGIREAVNTVLPVAPDAEDGGDDEDGDR